jgi:hypothetical protein
MRDGTGNTGRSGAVWIGLVGVNQGSLHLLIDKSRGIGICCCPLDVTGYLSCICGKCNRFPKPAFIREQHGWVKQDRALFGESEVLYGR